MLPREDEIEAYNRAMYLNNCLTPIFLTSMVLETASFFLYTNMVTKTFMFIFYVYFLQMHPWKKIIRGNTQEEETTTCFMCLKRVTNLKFEKHMTKFHAATCPMARLDEMCRRLHTTEARCPAIGFEAELLRLGYSFEHFLYAVEA